MQYDELEQRLGRREFLTRTTAVAAMGAATTFLPRGAVAASVAKITSVSDGNLELPLSFLFPDVPEADLKPFLAKHGVDGESLKPECNLTLAEIGDHKILFDAGSGSNFMPSAGQLPAMLESLDVELSDITDVIFTHGHPDHLWGILDDFDEITFPEANLHFPQVEWDFWRSQDSAKAMTEGREVFVVGAQNRMKLMEEKIQLFKSGSEVLPGIEAVDTAGHTPGHSSFVIHGATPQDSTMVLGDAITNDLVSFQKPDWPSGSDQDPQRGIATRKMLLDRLSHEKMNFIGYHLPNGGQGRVEKNKQQFRFVQES